MIAGHESAILVDVKFIKELYTDSLMRPSDISVSCFRLLRQHRQSRTISKAMLASLMKIAIDITSQFTMQSSGWRRGFATLSDWCGWRLARTTPPLRNRMRYYCRSQNYSLTFRRWRIIQRMLQHRLGERLGLVRGQHRSTMISSAITVRPLLPRCLISTPSTYRLLGDAARHYLPAGQ